MADFRNKLREKLLRLRDSLVERFGEREWFKKLRNTDLSRIADWANRTFQKQGFGLYGTLMTLLLCTYFVSDLAALVAARFIPEPPPARPVSAVPGQRKSRSLDEYNVIFTRNLFNSQGTIPGEEAAPPGMPLDEGGAPQKSTLPFNLIGTLILRDEIRSIATIEDKAASTVYPVRRDDEIPSKARIVSIEPRRVIFLNLASGRREYIDLPEEQGSGPKITLGARGGLSPVGPGVEQVAPTQFSISKSELDKALGPDLNNVLTQARAVPNFENGVVNGYKLFQIVPGSIYDKIGLKNGDVIMGADGQPVNDPGKAFELMGNLKNTNHLDLQIKREGKTISLSYDIH